MKTHCFTRACSRLAGLILAVQFSAVAQAQEPELHFSHLGVRDGLSHNSVRALTQDRRGFLWIGTDDGLNRFDGYEFQVHRLDPTSGASNHVVSLLGDSREQLWVGTARGLWLFDRDRGQFVPPPPGLSQALGDLWIGSLSEHAQGFLWIVTGNHLFRYVGERDELIEVANAAAEAEAPERTLIGRPAFTSSGALWMVESQLDPLQFSLLRVEPGELSAKRFAMPPSRARLGGIAVDLEDRLWVDASGPLRWQNGRLEKDQIPSDGEPQLTTSVLIDRSARIWHGTEEGILINEGLSGTPKGPFLTSPSPNWQRNYINTLFEDRDGAVWVGTLGGLFRWDPHAKPFRHLRFGSDPTRSDPTRSDPVSSLLEDREGALWIGFFGAGLVHRDANGRRVHYRHLATDSASLCDDRVWALAEDRDGTMWIGTEKGLCSYRPERGFRAHDLPFPSTGANGKQRVKQIVARANGTLWIGSNFGLFRFDPSTGETRLFGAGPNGLSIHGVGALISEPDGGLWIGSTSGWLNYLDAANETWRQFAITTSDGHPTPEAQVHDLFRDAEGILWLATTLGLGRFDPETARFELLLGALDLPGSVVFSIQADRKHRLWLGTNQGLVRYDRTQAGEARFRVYDLSDGVGNLEFNRHARWARPDGELLFGGMEGITAFSPDEIHDNPVRPHVAFTQIEILSREGESRREPASVERVVLSPNDTALSFEFTALSYTAPHRIRYAYRMEGLDQAWIDTGHRRFARYSRLPPGEYVFRVKAANNDGLWSKKAAAVAIVVEPHFWRTWWFLAAMIVAALAFTGLVHQARVRRLIASERMRLRIAADLHDDLGSELSGIAVGTALVSNRDYLKEPDRQRLEALSASAFRVMHDLRDVVWTLTPEHDTLGSFTRRLRSTAQHLIPDTDCVFETNCGNSDDPLPMRARRELMAIAKEALANAGRHSVAERVEIEFRVEEGHVTLIVADDGVGFDPRARVDGSGLANLRRRARTLGAEFILDTRPGGGTRIEVDFQL